MDKKTKVRKRRHYRIRKRVAGTAAKPRISVFRSSKHIYVQLIDDDCEKTIVSSSSMIKEVQEAKLSGVALAEKVGEIVGQAAKTAGINKAVFDRGGYKYHGRVKAVADSIRKAGLEF